MADAKDIRAIVREYERAVNAGDTERLVGLFGDDPTFYDPIGLVDDFADAAESQAEETALPPAFDGEENLLEFFERCADYFPNWEYTVEQIFVDEELPGAAFEWTGHARDGDAHLYVRAVDVFELSDGAVSTVRGYISKPDTFRWD
jgi:ketosteroid isomerase-like protein